jgi:MutS domain V
VDVERRVWGGALRSPELVLRRSVEVLDGLLHAVVEIRDVLGRERPAFRSPALLGLADRLAVDVDDAFLADARDGLRRLREPTLAATAGLGPGNRPAAFVLRRTPDARRGLRERVGLPGQRGLVIDVALHDQNAMNALAELRARAVADAAGAVAESAAHLLAFCRRLRDETAFLVGCANLDTALATRGVTRCLPEPLAGAVRGLTASAIVDPCLSLATDARLVDNDVDTAGRPLTVVTGANGGGKSTLLRAVGVARLLQAAGMPVAAGALAASLPTGILVHFPRPEQGGEGSGRLDAELRRLDSLVGRARPGSLVLLNEPLSTVNERDGSAIVDELLRGLVAGGAEVWLVTHHHELAARLHASPPGPTRFLRAERGDGSSRPFRVTEAPPLATSFGADLWAGEVDGEGAPHAVAEGD